MMSESFITYLTKELSITYGGPTVIEKRHGVFAAGAHQNSKAP